jgi:hypothetical protein
MPGRALLILPLAALHAAPTHAATWTTEPIPASHGSAGVVALATMPDGRAIGAFERFVDGRRSTRLATRAAGTPTWTDRGDLAGVGWGAARLHPYGSDRVLLVALERTGTGAYNRAIHRVAYAYGRGNGSFGRLRGIENRASRPASAVNRAGDATVAWTAAGGDRVRVAERRARRGFGRPVTRSPAAVATFTTAIGPQGDRVLAWQRRGRIEARIRRAGGSWGSVLRLGDAPRGLVTIKALVAPNGSGADVTESRPASLVVGAALRGVRGGWRERTLERLTVPTPLDPVAGAPPVIDSRGVIYALWTGAVTGGTGVKVTSLSPRSVGNPIVLSGAQTGAVLDDVAAGPSATLAVSWSSTVDDRTTTWATFRRRGGAFPSADLLTSEGETGLQGSRVTIDPTGPRVIVVRPVLEDGRAALRASTSD